MCPWHFERSPLGIAQRTLRRAKKKAAGCSIPGCNRTGFQCDLCWAHYDRKRRLGDPTAEPMRTANGETAEWVMMAVIVCWLSQTDDCLLHPFKSRDGYGSAMYDGHKYRLHELVLILTGRTPPGQSGHTRHLCGHPPCVNPRHIVIGTAKENAEDTARHGRVVRGEAHVSAKLTEDAVREIRTSSESQAVLSRRYGVSQSVISRVRQRKVWKHVV